MAAQAHFLASRRILKPLLRRFRLQHKACEWPPASTQFAHVFDRGAQADAQTAACSDATLPWKDKDTQQMSRRTKLGGKLVRLRDDSPLKNARASWSISL
jgi:hypothetical protein